MASVSRAGAQASCSKFASRRAMAPGNAIHDVTPPCTPLDSACVSNRGRGHIDMIREQCRRVPIDSGHISGYFPGAIRVRFWGH